MNTRDNTFIDAYGIDLTDDLSGHYAEPRRAELPAHQQPSSVSDAGSDGRSYRYDAGSAESSGPARVLRGPHFRLPRAEESQSAEPRTTWDDMSIIDVGVGWNSEILVSADNSSAAEPNPAEPVAETVNANMETASVVEPDLPEQPEKEVVREPAATDVQEQIAIQQRAAATTLPIVTPVVPAWEVDRFQWPAAIDALFEEQAEYFEHAGHKLLAASREGLTTLAITSACAGEGTTTVLLCLARAVAAAGGRVAVLDGNLENAQIGKALSLEFASGWQLVATGAVELSEAAIAGLDERITLFPAGVANEAVSSLADESVAQVLRRAAAGFDLLLIDAGQGELGATAELIDAAMVVRDVRRTSDQQSLATALLLREAGVKAVGIAENFSGAVGNAIAAAA